VTRVAIPIFRMKVSPVFDSCARVLLVDIEEDREVDRKEFYLDALSLNERLTILHKSGVDIVICSGISEVMEKMVLGKKIELISNITGEIETVLLLWQHKKPIFVIPAEAGNQEKSGCRIKSGMTELVSLLAGVIKAYMTGELSSTTFRGPGFQASSNRKGTYTKE